MTIHPDPRWGHTGHAMIHRQAVQTLPEEVPSFFREAEDRLESLASEPDRWKAREIPQLRVSTAPDHYLNGEFLGDRELPADRFAMVVDANKSGLTANQAGLLPYRVAELLENLTFDFAVWRNCQAHDQGKTPEALQAQENCIHDAGLLGHFVGDASQPLHATMHYDGWNPVAPNPHGYRTRKGLHREFESVLVNRFVDEQRVHDKIAPARELSGESLAIGGELARESNSHVEELYQLEKDGQLNPDQPGPAGLDFAESRLALGAQNLRDVWLTAWRRSEELAQHLDPGIEESELPR